MSANLISFLYLISGIFFILALRGLSNPESARMGNYFGITGMVIAAFTTLFISPPAGTVSYTHLTLPTIVGV